MLGRCFDSSARPDAGRSGFVADAPKSPIFWQVSPRGYACRSCSTALTALRCPRSSEFPLYLHRDRSNSNGPTILCAVAWIGRS